MILSLNLSSRLGRAQRRLGQHTRRMARTVFFFSMRTHGRQAARARSADSCNVLAYFFNYFLMKVCKFYLTILLITQELGYGWDSCDELECSSVFDIVSSVIIDFTWN